MPFRPCRPVLTQGGNDLRTVLTRTMQAAAIARREVAKRMLEERCDPGLVGHQDLWMCIEQLCHQHELLVLQPGSRGREVGASWQRACEVPDRGGEDLSEYEKASESSCPFKAGGAHDSQA